MEARCGQPGGLHHEKACAEQGPFAPVIVHLPPLPLETPWGFTSKEMAFPRTTMASAINLHEMWFGSSARIEPRIKEGINGDGETKCSGLLGGTTGMGSQGWSQGWVAPGSCSVGSVDAAEGRQSRKDKFREVLTKGAHLRALRLSKESGICGLLFRSLCNLPWFDLDGWGFLEAPS